VPPGRAWVENKAAPFVIGADMMLSEFSSELLVVRTTLPWPWKADGNLEIDGAAVGNGERAGTERTRARAHCEARGGGANLTVAQSLTSLATSMLPIPVQVVPRASVVAVHEVVRPQLVAPAVHSTELLPWAMSWKSDGWLAAML